MENTVNGDLSNSTSHSTESVPPPSTESVPPPSMESVPPPSTESVPPPSTDGVHDKPSSVNTLLDDKRELPTSQQSTETNNSNTNGAVNDVDPQPHLQITHPKLADADEPDTRNITKTPKNHLGVDDGIFSVDIGPRIGEDDDPKGGIPQNNGVNGFVPSSRRPSANSNFPYAPDPFVGNPRIIPDVNEYQNKKTLAQGMMDLALLSANANQLRYVLESFNQHPYFYFSLAFISFSIILQVAVGVGLILNSRYDVKKEDDICKANRINNFTVLGIFLITIVNVLISSFGVAEAPPQAREREPSQMYG